MPKRTIPLTDVAIRNAKAADKPVKLFDGAGLFLQVTPTGGKLWRFKYLFDGKERLLALGKWPDVGLKMARQRRDAARALVAEGIDPGAKRKQDKTVAKIQAAEDANTFEVVARDWHTKQVKAWSESHAAKIMGRLEQHLFSGVQRCFAALKEGFWESVAGAVRPVWGGTIVFGAFSRGGLTRGDSREARAVAP